MQMRSILTFIFFLSILTFNFGEKISAENTCLTNFMGCSNQTNYCNCIGKYGHCLKVFTKDYDVDIYFLSLCKHLNCDRNRCLMSKDSNTFLFPSVIIGIVFIIFVMFLSFK